MALTRERKRELVAQYVELLSASQAVYLSTYTGLTVAEIEELRKAMREVGGKFMVAKNTLVRIAFEQAGYPVPHDLLRGSTALSFALEDPAGVAKALTEFAKDHEAVQVKGGFLGREPITAAQIEQLASLPPLPVLRAQLLGTIMAPATRLARVLREPARQLAAVLQAYSEQGAAAAG